MSEDEIYDQMIQHFEEARQEREANQERPPAREWDSEDEYQWEQYH